MQRAEKSSSRVKEYVLFCGTDHCRYIPQVLFFKLFVRISHRAAARMNAAAREEHGGLCNNVPAEVIYIDRDSFRTGIQYSVIVLSDRVASIIWHVEDLQF